MKILLLYASLGAGHKRAAQALQELLQQRGIRNECRDLLEFLPRPMPWFYDWSYNFLITKARGLWRFLYNTLDRPKTPYQPARDFLQKWQFNRLKSYLRQEGFTHILSTHYTSSALLTDWRSENLLDAKIFSIITDYSAHRCWKRRNLDHYFVPSEDVAAELQAANISPEKITVSGIPVSSVFSDPPCREESRKNWNCRSDDRVALILCSALTLTGTLRLLHAVSELDSQLHFLISTGSDPHKEQQVKESFAKDERFTIVGFTSRIAEMMIASDVVISKPGGLIVSEALAMGIPLILLPAIPGQEEANARYAAANGAALSVEGIAACKDALTGVFANSQRLASMSAAAKRIGKPYAARTILDAVLS